MRLRLAAIVALAVVVAGCGGKASSAPDAATLVPANALAYLTIDTNVRSGQLTSAKQILDKFSFGPRALRVLSADATQEGISLKGLESSIGPQLDIAVLRVNGKLGAVGLTQPTNQKAFDRQLSSGSAKELHTTIGGWTAFADTQPFLDALKNRNAQLATDPAYTEAAKTLPGAGDAIASAFITPAGIGAVAGALLQRVVPSLRGQLKGATSSAGWIAAALSSSDGAVKLELHVKGAGASEVTTSSLADQIPSGAILAASFDGSKNRGTVSGNLGVLRTFSPRLGTNIAQLVKALNGPMILYVRPGRPLPDVTIAAKPADPKQVMTSVAQILKKLSGGQAKPVPTKVDGGTLEQLDLGSIDLYYGRLGDEVVATDSQTALAELKGSVGRLANDAIFKEAQSGAGLPSANQGFVFVDLKDAVTAVEALAKLANQKLPPSDLANLKPLRSLLFYGSHSNGVESLVAFLKTS
ncbi:MAG TPA: hypothetical protein VHV52_07600 [Gaiellaceae bacterium]|nr:hypothetical protein [Gaiellaceae bacterium]